MTLAMSWDEWTKHDARGPGRARAQGRADGGRTGGPGRGRHRPAQPAAERRGRGLRRRGGRPLRGRRPRRRLLRRRALPDEGPGPDDARAAAGDGLAVHARQPRHRGRLPHRPDAPRRAEPDGPHHHAGIRRVLVGREPGGLRHAQPLGPGLHHAGLVGRHFGHGGGRRAAAVACHRWRRLDPHPRRCQRQHRLEGIARRVLHRAQAVRPERAGLHPGLPEPHGARHGGLRRPLPRRRTG